MMYDWNDMGGWGWGGWLVMALMMLAFWGLIAAVAVAVIRGGSWRQSPLGPSPGERGDAAMQILDERFARGEIDAEEYRTRRELLRSH